MTEHDQKSSGVEVAANVQPSQGRRRLVKGVIIAMPAILTIRRGFAGPYGSLGTDPQALCGSDSFVAWNEAGRPQDKLPASVTSFLGSNTGLPDCLTP